MQQPIMEWNTQKKIWQHLTDNHLFELWEPFLGTWPTSGMTVNGLVYELPMQERLTTDSESSSLPTLPTTRASEPGSTSPGYGDSLNDVANRFANGFAPKDLMSTPKARDHQAEGYEAGLRRATPQLGTQMRAMVEGELLRTPVASEADGGATSPEVSKAKGQTLRLSGQMIDLVAPDQLPTLPTPTVFHVSMHDEPIDTFLAREEKSSTGQIGKSLGVAVRMEMMPTPTTRDYKDGTAEHERDGVVQTDTVARAVFNSGEVSDISWGKFEPAIRRWEEVIGRPAPAPTKPDGKDGNHRLSSAFTEWMMGVPEGWITGAGISRNEELKAAGNGVVPQQAELALRILLQNTDFQQDIE